MIFDGGRGPEAGKPNGVALMSGYFWWKYFVSIALY